MVTDSCLKVPKPCKQSILANTREQALSVGSWETFFPAKVIFTALGHWYSSQFVPRIWSRTYSEAHKEISCRLDKHMTKWHKLLSDYYKFHRQGRNPQQKYSLSKKRKSVRFSQCSQTTKQWERGKTFKFQGKKPPNLPVLTKRERWFWPLNSEEPKDSNWSCSVLLRKQKGRAKHP